MAEKVTASAIAAELRKLADSLDKEPEAELDKLYITFNFWYTDTAKARIQTMARLMPRPVKKSYTDTELELIYNTPAIRIVASAPRNVVCNILVPAKPAVYDCSALLTDEEEAELHNTAQAENE